MDYEDISIKDTAVPRAIAVAFQHAIDTYASETNKVASVWACFSDQDLFFSPDPKSSSVADIVKHQLLSERRFFGEFLGTPEPPPSEILPLPGLTIVSARARFIELATARLTWLAAQDPAWWLTRVRFFDVERERIWIFWRRVLHTAHHRTQLTAYLRPLGRPVPSTYGPTADVTWSGADPTNTVESAGRK